MINIDTPAGPPPVDTQILRAAAQAALAHESVAGDLTIVLTDDAQLQQLNREYLGHDAPTDVLSFPASESDPDERRVYLGDILISVQRADEQAREAFHPLETELRLLIVHGVLHLLGHDHAEPAGKARMWTAQAAILKSIGLGNLEIRE